MNYIISDEDNKLIAEFMGVKPEREVVTTLTTNEILACKDREEVFVKLNKYTNPKPGENFTDKLQQVEALNYPDYKSNVISLALVVETIKEMGWSYAFHYEKPGSTKVTFTNRGVKPVIYIESVSETLQSAIYQLVLKTITYLNRS